MKKRLEEAQRQQRLEQENRRLRDENEIYMRRLVKAADKLSAYIKCIEEEKAGNSEFKTAKISTGAKINSLCDELPELKDFIDEFLPSYGKTLDELI